MASVLITGATGLIGRWTMAAWPDDLDVSVLNHREHDLTDSEAFVAAVRAARPDVLLHLAWCASGTSGYRSSSDNALWSASSLSAARFCLDHDIHFVGTGTVLDEGPPADLYTAAKRELRQGLTAPIDEGSVTWIRPFYVFDHGSRRPALVEESVAAAAEDRDVELRSPDSTHDFIHAADVGRAVVAAVQHQLTGSIDVGSGRLRSVRQVAMACGAQVREAVAEDRMVDAVADTERLRKTGWSPTATAEFFSTVDGVVI
ncbi:MAG: NAD-dependent epimerase/dehydratase family protein [Marmoricola sp.]